MFSNLNFCPVGEVDRFVGDVDNVGLVGGQLAVGERTLQGPVLARKTLLHLN